MGAVYVVEQISTGKERALKVMHPQLVADPKLRERFQREARVGALIASDHVVEVIGAGVEPDSGMPWIAMELLKGDDLADHVTDHGCIPVEQLLEMLRQLCHALAAAHEAGVVHRDIKPENVFMARSRSATAPTAIKVLDFGIARIAAQAGTTATATLGSPAWMAPEQTEPRAKITPATDVWAVGLMTFWLLTGRPFWRSAADQEASVHALMREILFDPIPSAKERAIEYGVAARLPEGFDEWFGHCVVREPQDRFTDAAALLDAFETMVLQATPASTEGDSGRASAPAPPPRNSTRPISSSLDPASGQVEGASRSSDVPARPSTPIPTSQQAPVLGEKEPDGGSVIAAGAPAAAQFSRTSTPTVSEPPPIDESAFAPPPLRRSGAVVIVATLLLLVAAGGATLLWRSGPRSAATTIGEQVDEAVPTSAPASTGSALDAVPSASSPKVAVGWRGGRASLSPSATPSSAVASGSSSAAATSSPVASSSASASGSSSVSAASQGKSFDHPSAQREIARLTRAARSQCRSAPGPRTVGVTVVFSNDGKVARVNVHKSSRRGPMRSVFCVQKAFWAARVPPFSGRQQSVGTAVLLD